MSLRKYILFIAFLIATTVSVHLIAYAQTGPGGVGTGPSTGGAGSGSSKDIPEGFTKGACPDKEHNEEFDFATLKAEKSDVGTTDCTELNPIEAGKLCDPDFRKEIIDYLKKDPDQSVKCTTKTKEDLESDSFIKLKEIDAPTIKVKIKDAEGKDTGKTKDVPNPCYCGDLQVICSPEDIGGKKHTMIGTESSTKIFDDQNRIDQTTKYKIYKTKYTDPEDGKEKECVPKKDCQVKCP